MPTGYTAAIADGIRFEQYALSCARAFGALVTMRDEPADAPIPEKFLPSKYHADKIVDLKAELAKLLGMTDAERLAAHVVAQRKAVEYLAESHMKAEDLKRKYQSMLEKAKAYKAPTPEHQEFAQFMVSQIEESIDFDCTIHDEYYPKVSSDPDEWLYESIRKLIRDIEYQEKEAKEEISRTAKRNAWVKALRESLR